MAKKKKSNSSYDTRQRAKKCWEAGSHEQWDAFLKQHNPRVGVQFKMSNTTILTNCIAHNDSTPSMHIVPTKGFVKCFSCGYYESNPLRFLEKFTGKSVAEVVKEVQVAFDVKLLSKADMKQSEEEFKHVEMKNGIYRFCNNALIEAHQKWIDLDKNEPLFKETEWYHALETLKYIEFRLPKAHDYFHILPIGILPTTKQLRTMAETELKDGKRVFSGHDILQMEAYLEKYKNLYYLGSLVYIYHSTPTDVSRFRLRIATETDQAKKIISIDDDREDRLGVFGLGMYGYLTPKTGDEGIGYTTKTIIVEGEMDCLHYAILATEAANMDLIVLAHCGATSREFSEITNYGIRNAYYIPDYDEGGETNCKEVLKLNPQIKFRVFVWPAGILDPDKPSTDLDDALRIYGFDVVHDELKEWDKNWIKPEYWVKQQISKQVIRRGIEDDPPAISKLVFDYAACVGDATDVDQATQVTNWMNQALIDFGVSNDDAKKMANDFLAKESPELVFCQMLRDRLCEYFEFVSIDRPKMALPVKVWHRRNHYLIEIRVGSDAHIKASMTTSLGKLTDWVKQEVGVPEFIQIGRDKTGEVYERSIVLQEDEILKYLTLALREIIFKLPPTSTFQRKSAGTHFLTTLEGVVTAVVNGRHIYKITYDETDQMSAVELESPVLENFLFDPTASSWSPEMSLEELNKPQKMDIETRFLKNLAIISCGWVFESQDTEPYGLAALAMAMVVLPGFPQNLQFLAANERSTGKSTLYAELFGGGKNTEINLVEHRQFVDNATPAGIRQAMDGSTLTLILDEFDNNLGGKYRSEKMEEVMTILRTSSAGEGKYLQGTVGGEPRTFYMNFSSMIAGIDPDMTDANMTRFFTTDLKSGISDKKPPKVEILNRFTAKDIHDLRISNTMDTLKDWPKIQRSYNEVKKYCFEHPEMFGNATLQRFKDNMMVLMGIMKAANADWKTWCVSTCKAKEPAVKKLTKRTVNENLFQTVMFTPSIVLGGFENRRMMVAQFLVSAHSPEERNKLNTSGCGAYIYEDPIAGKWYMMVLWQEAVNGVLKGTSMVRLKDDPHSLQTIAERHPLAVPREEADKLTHRLEYLPQYLNYAPYTFFDITERVQKEVLKWEESRESALVKMKKAPEEQQYMPDAN